jgi:hypothetical protein
MFFSDEKNQKTFTFSGIIPTLGTRPGSIRRRRKKSLLLLFFRKEDFSASLGIEDMETDWPVSVRTQRASGSTGNGGGAFFCSGKAVLS